ncbi:MAG: LD-carboxypeptidase [Erysipelotrichaceae bacterium]|nr:LD-carboxypeptidase [Erysipelotrichaceae bacterium]MDY5252085.1 LD-carboxypeptidase [Erysipelotrichaceae bacterium]
MYYPRFPQKGETIGICAPSAGVGNSLEGYQLALQQLSQFFQIKETAHVRSNGVRSTDAKTRAQEVMELFADENCQMVICARGGEFLFEILPEIDFTLLTQHPKWFLGASDPTSLLYCLTTKYDIATLYGQSATSFDVKHKYLDDCLQLMQGQLITQTNYDFYQKPDYEATTIVYDQKVSYLQNQDEIMLSGRLIGGCIDVIKNIINTPYDGTLDFINRYQNDGIIWFFDNYALSAEDFYLTILQMKYAGYFQHTKAIINGRTVFPASFTGLTYFEALKMALPDIAIISEADIGHTKPRMTLINGSYATICAKNKTFTINFELK